jgi:hypothetical protein
MHTATVWLQPTPEKMKGKTMKLNQLKIPVTIKISFHFTAVMPPLKTHDAF